jgi:hypothetical protein
VEAVATILGVIVALIGIGAGIVQIIDYVERKRQKNTALSKKQKPIQVNSTLITVPVIEQIYSKLGAPVNSPNLASEDMKRLGTQRHPDRLST